MSEGYNGWSNYETWLANLWIQEGVLDLFEMGEQARYFAESGESTAPYRMGEWLKDQVGEYLCEMGGGDKLHATGMGSDLLGAALSRVDFAEIGRHFTDEAIQNEAEQTANANA